MIGCINLIYSIPKIRCEFNIFQFNKLSFEQQPDHKLII